MVDANEEGRETAQLNLLLFFPTATRDQEEAAGALELSLSQLV
jgi:hypothetical protein